MLHNKCKAGLIFFLFALILSLGGCAADGIRGYAQADRELLKAFRNYQLNPAYQYYLHGAGNNYYALLGLDPQYTVPIHKMWKAMDINDPEMTAISNFLWEKFPIYERMGFHLLDSFGNVIGEIYTSVTFSYLIQEDDTLIFYFDTPWLRDNYMF